MAKQKIKDFLGNESDQNVYNDENACQTESKLGPTMMIPNCSEYIFLLAFFPFYLFPYSS